MSFDSIMRTFGVLTCLYTVAYFVTTMSVAALNAVTYSSGPMCGETGCVTIARRDPHVPKLGPTNDDAPLWTAVAFLTND